MANHLILFIDYLNSFDDPYIQSLLKRSKVTTTNNNVRRHHIMKVDFTKGGGLVPAIIQDAVTKNVLMLGYMNEESLAKTLETKKVTFWSRSRNTLWTKGETSGNFLDLVDIKVDCDNDTLLVKVHPHGPTCHTGTDTCWGEENK